MTIFLNKDIQELTLRGPACQVLLSSSLAGFWEHVELHSLDLRMSGVLLPTHYALADFFCPSLTKLTVSGYKRGHRLPSIASLLTQLQTVQHLVLDVEESQWLADGQQNLGICMQ